jgi:opacity protein-like surface antigen
MIGIMRNAVLSLGLAAVAASPLAWGSPWYAGGGLGVSDFAGCPGAASCDSRDQAYKVYAGYRFTRHLAVEAGYTDLGKATATLGDSITETKPRGMAAHAVGAWPLSERFSLLGRIGLIYGDSKVTGTAPTRNEKGTELAWGAGVQFDVAPQIAVRLEWERFEFREAVDAITLGVVARF